VIPAHTGGEKGNDTHMSDDRLLAALQRIETEQTSQGQRLERIELRLERIETEQTSHGQRLERIETQQTRLRELINNKLESILDQLKAVREDLDTTRAHVLYGLQENLTVSQRVARLEEQMRRPPL
jgi:hypothetical protein